MPVSRSWSSLPWRVLCSALLVLACGALPAQTDGYLSESQIQVGYLYNFAKYIEWPADAFAAGDAPFVVCIVGRDSLGTALSALEGRSVRGHALQVRRGVPAEHMAGCHIAYIDSSEEGRAARSLLNRAHALLTVSEIGGFVDIGGGIGLVHNDERLLFDVNQEALDHAHLKASSQMLKLARHVVMARGD